MRSGEFQSTPARGQRHAALGDLAWPHRFNPRPRAGNDEGTARSSDRVSIHARARATTDASFNPRPRAGNDHARPVRGLFQSTPARGQRRIRRERACVRALRNVSIHARARATTFGDLAHRAARTCFNPRPRAGNDAHRAAHSATIHRFNPRPRAGNDACPSTITLLQYSVSIHARARATTHSRRCPPARGVSIHARARATTYSARGNAIGCFNPRPRAGNDIASASGQPIAMFQSTPARGQRPYGRQYAGASRVSIHARARATTREASVRRLGSAHRVSIHARARATTTRACEIGQRRTHVSIHARARATTATRPGSRRCSRFNPRPRAGNDCDCGGEPRHAFQSTPARGQRRMRSTIRFARFNPRPRAGNDMVRDATCIAGIDVSIHARARATTATA
jgi:hypothetical protein